MKWALANQTSFKGTIESMHNSSYEADATNFLLRMFAMCSAFEFVFLSVRYHKGVFTRMANTIGVEFLTKKIVLQDLPVIKA